MRKATKIENRSLRHGAMTLFIVILFIGLLQYSCAPERVRMKNNRVSRSLFCEYKKQLNNRIFDDFFALLPNKYPKGSFGSANSYATDFSIRGYSHMIAIYIFNQKKFQKESEYLKNHAKHDISTAISTNMRFQINETLLGIISKQNDTIKVVNPIEYLGKLQYSIDIEEFSLYIMGNGRGEAFSDYGFQLTGLQNRDFNYIYGAYVSKTNTEIIYWSLIY